MFIRKNEYLFKYPFQEDFFYKDCSLNYLMRKLDPVLVNTILSIGDSLPQTKQFRTYDVSFRRFNSGDKTCVDTGWHCDGLNNQYLIYCKGDFRTKILPEESPSFFPQERSQIRELNQRLAAEFRSFSGTEIDDSTPYLYTSSDIHKGRDADKTGERFFLRICESDYLKPKNVNMMRILNGKTK